ncbi:MAG: LEA type 2 family protein [Bacteroidales bacterium]|jgi:hypothetical protein|nr:LEA type 2 family protein [Bacteroidales bacterium]
MKSGGKILLFGVIATGLILAKNFITTGAHLLKLTGYPSKIRYIKQAGFLANVTSQKFAIDFAIKNPNKKGLTFNRLNCDVFYNKKPIANILLEKNIPLAGNETTILSGIVFDVSLISVGTEFFNLIRSGELSKEFVFNGTMTADGLTFPVNKTISL